MKTFKTNVPYMEFDIKLHLRIRNSPLKGGEGSIGYVRLVWYNAPYDTFNTKELNRQFKDISKYYGVTVSDLEIVSREEWSRCNPQKTKIDTDCDKFKHRFVLNLRVKHGEVYKEHFVEYPYINEGATKLSTFISEYAESLGIKTKDIKILSNSSEIIEEIPDEKIEILKNLT